MRIIDGKVAGMAKSTGMEHDRLFKELLTTFFVEFLDLFFPEVKQYLDRRSIEFLDKEVFTDIASGERHEVDLLAKAKFRGREAFFLIHVENQAKAKEAFGQRMFKYFARLHEKYQLPVYPIVLFSYDNPKVQATSSYEVSFPAWKVLDFRYRTIQLNRLNWRDFFEAAQSGGQCADGEDEDRIRRSAKGETGVLEDDSAVETQYRAKFAHRNVYGELFEANSG